MNILRKLKHILFIIQLRLGNSLLQKFGNQVYHVIGDSHTLNFLNPHFIIHHVGAATAYRLNSEISTTMSREKVTGIIDKIYKGKRINIIFVFGELDARIHIYKASKEKKVSIKSLIRITVDEYMKFIYFIKSNYPLIDVYIFNVLPTGEEKNIYKVNYYPKKEKRIEIVSLLNSELREKSKNNNYKFIYIYPKLVDENGNRKKEYIFDKVHFNRKIIPFIMSEIKL